MRTGFVLINLHIRTHTNMTMYRMACSIPLEFRVGVRAGFGEVRNGNRLGTPTRGAESSLIPNLGFKKA